MAYQEINRGSVANDRQGDSLREAFRKVNENFVEIYPQSVPTTSIGANGDVAGMIAFDNTYFYYCTANYDGTANIWKRLTHAADTW